jgi:hypothetical protein
MTGIVERDGNAWLIRESIRLQGRSIDSYWGGSEWIQERDKAERFKTKAAAKVRTASLRPVETKQVKSALTIPLEWDDSRALSALLSRAENLIARGLMLDTPAAASLIQAVRGDNGHQAELSHRLRNLCESAEARSSAEALFSQIMYRGAADRVAFIKAMTQPAPPTYEEEWLDFKSGFDGPLLNPKPLSDRFIKETWSTALSGFANTGGGLLIWGIDARKTPLASDPGKMVDAAGDLRLVQHPDSLKSQLMTLHHAATDPPVVGVRVEPIGDPAGGGFVVCFIPESRNKPHRAEFFTHKPYYMRAGDDFVVMPTVVLRSMFFPQVNPRYSVQIECRGRNLQNPKIATVDFVVTIMNVSNATAGEPFVVFQIDPWGNTSQTSEHDAGWRLVHVKNGVAFRGSGSIHPGAFAPSIRMSFPIGGLDLSGQIVVDCGIYSLNAKARRFRAVFDRAQVFAGKAFVTDASELSE